MRILTYANPFELQNNDELWSLITSHPHYCASDTLVQGLAHCYGRKPFRTLRPVQDLLDIFYKEYAANPINDMQLFLTVSNEIRKWDDDEIKQSFLFNKADVVKAIQLLIPLECEPSKFIKQHLSEEQRRIIDLLQTVIKSPCYDAFKKCLGKNVNDYKQAVNETNIGEVRFAIDSLSDLSDSSFREKLGLDYPINTCEAAIRAGTTVLNDYSKEFPFDEFPDRIQQSLRSAISLCEDQEPDYYTTVIFHGIHQITPLMYYLFNNLEKLGIKVIFLINYAENLPRLYQTWKNVYAWCDSRFEFAEPLNLEAGNTIGQSYAAVIEGKKPDKVNAKVTEYASMTSFAIHEVGETYRKTKPSPKQKGVLSKMKTQYYAVQGRECNEILKMYYPEQFREKPFLSYPIGQFILGLYQMWDFEEKRLKLNPTSLSECVISGICKPAPSILDTIRKTRLFFSDVDSYGEYLLRISSLEKVKSSFSVGKNRDWEFLERISFYNLQKEDLDAFKEYLGHIQALAEKLFSGMSDNIDYLRHFRQLIELITTPEIGGDCLTAPEQELIQEVSNRLAFPTNDQTVGNTRDLKDALAFFLAGRKETDSSNWIVRDFMQIDGGVFQSKKKNPTTAYHFALLSNEHMNKSIVEELPWPLTVELFNQYGEYANAITAVTTGLREKRAFLRYILFYGLFFSGIKRIELSFIREEHGEKQSPYYLLTAMGLEAENYPEPAKLTMLFEHVGKKGSALYGCKLNTEENELFTVCQFKYLLSRVLKAPIEYSSEYHIKYYLSFVLAYVVWKRSGGKKYLLQQELDHCTTELALMFPFWGNVVFADIRARAEEELNRAISFSGGTPFSSQYIRRKKNYLVAQWEDPLTGKQHPFFNRDADIAWNDYMNRSQLYPSLDKLPPAGLCNDCSFAEICLRNFYDARIDSEED